MLKYGFDCNVDVRRADKLDAGMHDDVVDDDDGGGDDKEDAAGGVMVDDVAVVW